MDCTSSRRNQQEEGILSDLINVIHDLTGTGGCRSFIRGIVDVHLLVIFGKSFAEVVT